MALEKVVGTVDNESVFYTTLVFYRSGGEGDIEPHPFVLLRSVFPVSIWSVYAI